MAIEPTKQTILDQSFYVPKGVIDVRQANAADSGQDYYGDASSGGASGGGTGGSADFPFPQGTTPGVLPPTSFTVISQQVRIAPDGGLVVDVILEFPDVPGVDHIDVRIAKAVTTP